MPADVTEIQNVLNKAAKGGGESAIHNAAGYASFAAHVAHGKDERFGDGRQTE